MTLANGADMPQVRAIATQKLQQRPAAPDRDVDGERRRVAHATLLAADIKRFLDRPFAPATRTELPTPPPGAPIGEPAMDWLGTLAPLCSWDK